MTAAELTALDLLTDPRGPFAHPLGRPRVLRNGMPDFLVETPGGVYAVEVKGPGDSIRRTQVNVGLALGGSGVRSLVAHVLDGTVYLAPMSHVALNLGVVEDGDPVAAAIGRMQHEWTRESPEMWVAA